VNAQAEYAREGANEFGEFVDMREKVEAGGLPDKEYREFKRDIFAAIWRDLDPLEKQIEDNEHVPHEIVDPLLRWMRAFGLLVPKP